MLFQLSYVPVLTLQAHPRVVDLSASFERHVDPDRGETLAEPAWLTQIEEPVSLAALESGNRMQADPGLDMLPPRTPDTDLNKLDQLMDREPERVAAQVRQWMSED